MEITRQEACAQFGLDGQGQCIHAAHGLLEREPGGHRGSHNFAQTLAMARRAEHDRQPSRHAAHGLQREAIGGGL